MADVEWVVRNLAKIQYRMLFGWPFASDHVTTGTPQPTDIDYVKNERYRHRTSY